MKICCDLDDVLADCTGDIMRHMGLTNWKRLDHTIRERDIIKMYNHVTGMEYEPAVFWEHFQREFWGNLTRTSWCYDLIDMFPTFVPKEDIVILTSPTKCGNSLSGKLDWIHQYMPAWLHRQFIITPRKQFCANDSVLIDDCEENINDFVKAGGEGILFPQPFNHNHFLMGSEISFVKRELERIL